MPFKPSRTLESCLAPMNQMQKNILKQRIFMVVAICCGSLASALFFMNRGGSVPSLSDSEARSMGYASADDVAKVGKDFNKYWSEIVGSGRLTDAQFVMAKESLSKGSFASQIRVISVLGYLKGEKELARALTLLPKDDIQDDMYGLWRSSVKRWLDGPQDSTVYKLLNASGNKNALKISKELSDASRA